jgi:hypothetical protein
MAGGWPVRHCASILWRQVSDSLGSDTTRRDELDSGCPEALHPICDGLAANCFRIGASEDEPTNRRRHDEPLVEEKYLGREAEDSRGEDSAYNAKQIAGWDSHVQETCEGPSSMHDAQHSDDRLRPSELDGARGLFDIAANSPRKTMSRGHRLSASTASIAVVLP